MPESCTDQVVPWALFALLTGVGIGVLITWILGSAPSLPKLPAVVGETALRVVRDEKGNILEILPGA